MYIIYILILGLAMGYLAVPLIQRFGYNYGMFGRVKDMALVFFGVVFAGLIIGSIVLATGDTGVLLVGFIGGLIVIGVITLLSTKSGGDEEAQIRDLNENG